MQVVYLCRGSDCRERKLSRKRLAEFVTGLPVVTVRCQKVCKSPVVGVDLGQGPRWFRRLESDKALSALARYIDTGKLTDGLAQREAKKRAGRLKT